MSHGLSNIEILEREIKNLKEKEKMLEKRVQELTTENNELYKTRVKAQPQSIPRDQKLQHCYFCKQTYPLDMCHVCIRNY
jgi:hypothetical protein